MPEAPDLAGKYRFEKPLAQVGDPLPRRLLRRVQLAQPAPRERPHLLQLTVSEGVGKRITGAGPHRGRTGRDGNVARRIFADPEDELFVLVLFHSQGSVSALTIRS